MKLSPQQQRRIVPSRQFHNWKTAFLGGGGEGKGKLARWSSLFKRGSLFNKKGGKVKAKDRNFNFSRLPEKSREGEKEIFVEEKTWSEGHVSPSPSEKRGCLSRGKERRKSLCWR